MANKTRKITSQGQTVKGALAAYVAPKLAADGTIKPGELDALLKSIKPQPYVEQIPLIADAVKAKFSKRLAQDLDLEDLPDILEALKNAKDDLGDESDEDGSDDEGEDEATPEIGTDDDDEDMSDDAEAGEAEGEPDAENEAEGEAEGGEEEPGEAESHPGIKLMKMLSGYDIPSEDLEQMNELITALSKGEGGSVKESTKDKFPAGAAAKPFVKKGEKQEPEAEPMNKPAMDAAFKDIEKRTRENIASLFGAAEVVAPIIGKIDTLAFDSADAIYALALKELNVPIEGIHPSAYKSLLQFANTRKTERVMVAADAVAADEFEKRYTNIPAQA